ncbi:MAG: cation:proton antiporter regulatory subunit [Salinigranum sp.]
MTVYESDLPGVGKKFEVDLDDGSRLVVVTHNTGKREVFLRATEQSDSEKLFELSDDLARQVGTILEGAYFQPVRSHDIETLLGEDTLIEWVEIGPSSPLAGRTLGEEGVRRRFDASVIALQRGEETVTNPSGGTRIEAGDTLVVIGSREACRSFERYAAGDG